MGFIRFLRDVVCAPYSIPIGLINGKKPLGMCSETTKKELNLSEVTSHNKAYSGRVGTQTEDVSSITQYEVLNEAIQNILRRNTQRTVQTIDASNQANITCDLVVPIEDDPHSIYDTKLRLLREVKIGDDGKRYPLPVFDASDASLGGCCPVVDQLITLEVSTWENITELDIEDMYNEVDINIENTLMEQGGDTVLGTSASTLSSMNIKTILKQRIRETIKNSTEQNTNISQGLNYIDRYGRCEHIMDDDGRWWFESKRLKQFITIEMLSRNIIESVNKLIMNNQTQMDSTTRTVVNRITNYRIIVVSFLCNVIICYIFFKLFMNMLQRMN